MRVERVESAPLEGADGVTLTTVVGWAEPARFRIDVVVMEPGAVLPRHPAGADQLFCVLSGTGRVAGDDGAALPVGPGAVARWQRGEHHTSWADSPMQALIVQREG